MTILDLSPREIAVFAPLVLLVLWMGIYPKSFLEFMSPTVEQLIAHHQTALGDTKATGLADLLGGSWQAILTVVR